VRDEIGSASEPFRVQFAATYRALQNAHRRDELVALQAIEAASYWQIS
jgi:hypothetical protein